VLNVSGRVLFALLFLSLFAGCSFAQYSSSIQGVVTDSSGAAVADAGILLRNVDTGVQQTTATSSSGNYSFPALAPGRYVVRAESKGLQTKEVNVTLGTAETQGINITLAVAAVSETMTVVTEQAQPIDPDDSRIQATLNAQTVQELPELNRNLWDTLSVTPGVVGNGTRGAGNSPGGGSDNFGTQTPQISANGRSYTGNVVYVDGMNVTSPVQNGNLILSPVPDAVQEVTMQANSWDAENQLGSSVLVQVTTKSGTNQFHGTGSLLYTNQDLQANPDFFSPVRFQRKDVSAALGGPVIKNKLFFFADVESLWSKTPTSVSLAGSGTTSTFWESPQFDQWAQQNFPNTTGTQVLGLYTPKYLIPNGTTESAGQVYYRNTPAGNCAAGQTVISITSTVTIPCNLPMLDFGSFSAAPVYNATQYNFRGDWYATSRDRIYLSYYNDSFNIGELAPRAGLSAQDIMRNRYADIDYTHTFSSTLLAEGGFAFASVGGANGQDANLRVPIINILDGTQGFNVGGGWGPGEYRGPNYNWRAVLTWVHGAHTLKFGYDGDHAIEHGDFTPVSVRPTLSFNTLFDLVQDNVYQYTFSAYDPFTGQAGKVVFGGQTNPFGFFAQDNWKVKSNLSLTLALRWDDFTNHTAWGNSGFKFNTLFLGAGSTLSQQIADATVGPVNQVFANNQNNNWSPRIGFAWDPTKSGKWSVRGGVGVYRDWVALGQSVDEMRTNPPSLIGTTFTNTVTYNGVTTPLSNYFALASSGNYPYNFPLPPIPAGTLNPAGGITGVQSNVWALARNMVPPLAVNYVIGVEHEIPWRLVAGASYSGSRSYDGLTGANENVYNGGAVLNPCPTATNPNQQCETINYLNPNFGTINYVTNNNRSTYNAMILSLRGNPTTHLNFQASYTLSHTMDFPEANTRFDQDTTPYALNIPDPTMYFQYWGDANWDVRNRFSLSGIYTLPGFSSGWAKVVTSGWSLSSIIVAQSGTPFWVYNGASLLAGGDYNHNGLNYDIPNVPSSGCSVSYSRSAYKNGLFASGYFSAPAPLTQGNEPRNCFRNPGMVNVDTSVAKNTHMPWLGEAGNLQLRFDFLNLFNHPNLGPVDANMADGNFGKVTSALGARQIQLIARISF
jgi:Carboxypeptidase regulatory-like domain/TonB dependent receptor